MLMRYVVVGLGNIGQRRQALLGARCVATADPFNETAAYRSVRDVPVDAFDAAVLAIPDDDKIELVSYLLEQGKHVLVEKPLPLPDQETTRRLEELARSRGLSLYTAYNHRFEPLLVEFKEQVGAGAIGEIYHGRLFYGNGTVRHVAGTWRDQGLGAIQDLGCHLLDLLAFAVLPPHPPTPSFLPWSLSASPPLHGPASGRGGERGQGSPSPPQWGGGQEVGDTMLLIAAQSIETAAPDHAIMTSADGRFTLEVTYHSWRNSFAFELYGSEGSIHCYGLRKWGGSELLVRKRVFPSGRPHETRLTDEGPDITWEREIAHFEQRCAAGQTDLSTDRWIARTLRGLEGQL
jgi:scyllo-inositol 2-dehydrogenase (NADP+)